MPRERARGAAEDASIIALQVQFESQRLGQSESEWRAGLLAALAYQRMGNQQSAYNQASQADMSLATLQSKMGENLFALYRLRPDIRQQCQQLDELIRNKN